MSDDPSDEEVERRARSVVKRIVAERTPEPSLSPPGTLGDAALGYGAAIVAGAFAMSLLLAISPDLDEGVVALVVSSLSMWVGFVGAPVVVSRTRGSGDVRRDFALTAKARDVVVGLPIGVATQLLLLPGIYALLGLFIDVSSVSDPAEQTMGRGSGIGIVIVLLVVGLGAPLAEELFFRGLFQAAAIKRFGTAKGVVLVAAVFGATHLQPLQFVGLFAAGLIFGVLAWRTGRLGASVAAHVGFNMAAAVMLTVG